MRHEQRSDFIAVTTSVVFLPSNLLIIFVGGVSSVLQRRLDRKQSSGFSIYKGRNRDREKLFKESRFVS